MLSEKIKKLESVLNSMEGIAIAVSGGVDSMTLAFGAHRWVENCEMYHAQSQAVPQKALERVRRYAEKFQWDLKIINAGEMSNQHYLSNPVNRCYYCKTSLYSSISRITEKMVISGTNTDDLSDYRPGLQAASELQVRHPYVEAGIDKATVRALAEFWGLKDLKDLPAAPCLSSRVTTGIAINPEILLLIDQMEEKIWTLLPPTRQVKGVRCRIRSDHIAVELDAGEDVMGDGSLICAIENALRQMLTTRDSATSAPPIPPGIDLRIERYKRGSAFLIKSVDIGH